jgi:N,N-dimethylformamidase
MSKLPICGYCDRPNVRPGESLTFFVSTEAPGRCEPSLVRLIHGDRNPAGPGYREQPVRSPLDGSYDVHPQRTQVGGYVEIPDVQHRLAGRDGLTVHFFLWATLPGLRQGVVSRWSESDRSGWALLLENGKLVLVLGDGSTTTRIEGPAPIFPQVWYSVVARVDPGAMRASLSQEVKLNSVNSRFGRMVDIEGDGASSGALTALPVAAGVPVIIAGLAEGQGPGRTWVTGLYNGKVDAPKVYPRAVSDSEQRELHAGRTPQGAAAHWDFSLGITRKGIPSDSVSDASGNQFHGRCNNQPDRAMTGWNWDGHEEHFVHCPEQYGAIWFHSDSLDDCRWQPSFTLTIPQDLPSGAYAVKLNMGAREDRIPFLVVPKRGTPTARIALVLPTFSYMAYANSQVMQNAPGAQSVMGVLTTLDDLDIALHTDSSFGLSTYDYHVDGRGVQYSSWRRPILSLRPGYRHEFGSVWQFPADLHLIDWLTAKRFKFDVLTDHDLHAEGAALLAQYAVVISPSHAEYSSGPLLDAYEEYFANGGRGMYLGANGFYWIATPHPEKPWLIEVRKGESGDQAWRACPGELYHSTTGERGGLWRARARAPQKIWATGYTSHCLEASVAYYQMPEAADPRLAWMMEGIQRDEIIGNFGLVNGGAAGLEVDRIDYALGTPPNTMLLACSHGHSASAMLVPEEQYFAYPGITGRDNPLVRSDIAYVTTRKGGAVFSTSSMAWCGSLSHANYSNNVSRLTENVLRRFEGSEALPQIV